MKKGLIRIIGVLIVTCLFFQTICFADEIDPGFEYRGTQTPSVSANIDRNLPDFHAIFFIGVVVVLVVCISYLILKNIKDKNNSEFSDILTEDKNSKEE